MFVPATIVELDANRRGARASARLCAPLFVGPVVRASEKILVANFDADIAERYGWVNRTPDDEDLDSLFPVGLLFLKRSLDT